MSRASYRYCFRPNVEMDDVESSLALAILGAEALHGETETRLNAAHAFDAKRFSCVIGASTKVGRSLNRLFLGYLRREFGDDAFTVSRVSTDRPRAGEHNGIGGDGQREIGDQL